MDDKELLEEELKEENRNSVEMTDEEINEANEFWKQQKNVFI